MCGFQPLHTQKLVAEISPLDFLHLFLRLSCPQYLYVSQSFLTLILILTPLRDICSSPDHCRYFPLSLRSPCSVCSEHTLPVPEFLFASTSPGFSISFTKPLSTSWVILSAFLQLQWLRVSGPPIWHTYPLPSTLLVSIR